MTKEPSSPDVKSVDHIHIPPLIFDANEYLKYIEDYDLSKAEQQELLETLWNIIIQFVDLGFGIHPIQQACEQTETNASKPKLNILDALYSLENGKKGGLQCSKQK